jgi:type VII secretion-associated serine protease mycosin
LVRRWRLVALVVTGLLVMGSAVSSASLSRPFQVQRLPRPVVGGHGAVPADQPVSVGSGPTTGPAAQLPRPGASHGSSAQPALPVASVLVKFKGGTADSVRDRALGRRHATVVGSVGDTGYTKVQPSGDPAALVAALKADPSVDAVTLNYGRRTSSVPNDPGWSSGPQSPYLSTVRLPQAWDLITDARSQLVAIVDTGVDTSHPDLVGHTLPGYNVVQPGTPPTDQDGHGTFVAGVVAANANNAVGVAGTTWNGMVLPVKVFTGDVAFDSDTAVGIRYAADHGAKVINLSLGGPGDSPILHDAVAYAASRNVVVVAASGNTGDKVPQFPAAYPEVLAVGATDEAGALTDFSSYGDWLDLAAPGFNIVSTYLGGSYAIGDGTSFAAPIVSGIAALVRARFPNLTAAQVADRLRHSARDAGPHGVDPYYGWGVVDAAYAVGGSFGTAFPLAGDATEPNDVAARATPLPGLATQGILATEGDDDWYSYQETQNRMVTIRVDAPGPYNPAFAHNVDPTFDVYDASLGRLASVDQHGPGESESVTLAVAPGAHYIKVHNVNGAADTRPYAVQIFSGDSTLFDPAQLIPVNIEVESIRVGDVTGDGRDDIVFGSLNEVLGSPDLQGKLFVVAQKPDGTLAAPVHYDPVQSTQMTSIGLLDVDRDGRRDVVVAGPDGLEWFKQTSGGVLASQGLLLASSGGVGMVVAADIDGDGVDDIALIEPSGLKLLTHGAGSSFSLSPVSAGSIAVGELEAGDLDGDGRTDLAAWSNSDVHIFHNTVSGWTHTVVSTTDPWRFAGIEVADVTGDGKADLIATTPGTGASGLVSVFRQKNDGTLADAVTYPSFNVPKAVEAADVNHDGRTDVVVANQGWGAVTVLLQQPDGTLAPYSMVPGPISQLIGPLGVAVGDLNGDGRTDVVGPGDIATNGPGVVVFRQASGAAAPATAQEFVRMVTPSDSTDAWGLNTAPQVGFQVDINPASLTSSTVKLIDGRTGSVVPSSLSYNASAKTVTVTPTTALHDANPYRIVVNGVSDTSGNPQPWPFTSTFATAHAAPLAVNYTVAGGVGSVDFTFSPQIGDLDQIIVRAAVGSTPPASPTSGIGLYSGVDSGVTIGGLTPGTTYSFALWERDRTGALSPIRTATLVGSTLTLSNQPGTPTTTTSPITFTAHLTRADTGGAWSGQAVQLQASCLGGPTGVAATATTNASGDVTATISQNLPRCTYHWQVSGLSTFMGSASAAVRVDAYIIQPPNTPPHTR